MVVQFIFPQFCKSHRFDEIRISRSVSESPLDFEITRVDGTSNEYSQCILLMVTHKICFSWSNK